VWHQVLVSHKHPLALLRCVSGILLLPRLLLLCRLLLCGLLLLGLLLPCLLLLSRLLLLLLCLLLRLFRWRLLCYLLLLLLCLLLRWLLFCCSLSSLRRAVAAADSRVARGWSERRTGDDAWTAASSKQRAASGCRTACKQMRTWAGSMCWCAGVGSMNDD